MTPRSPAKPALRRRVLASALLLACVCSPQARTVAPAPAMDAPAIHPAVWPQPAWPLPRDAALERISRPEMDEHFLQQEFEYAAHKLGLTVDELRQLFELPKKTYRDYKNKRWLIGMGANAMRWLGLEKRYFR